ncbi:MAG: methylated-DNA--[protein]-cysteine S-methyltransferase [Candidatus Hodarchaeales archaeon]
MGATSKGCCFLEFQDTHSLEEIKNCVKKHYSLNMVRKTNNILDQIENELDMYFKGELQEFTTPLDIRGTEFEMIVWKRLQRIPYGETKSYGEIAELIKKPRAVRAVGMANGKNPVAIVVPCHRVISSEGKLHGYGGGLWRKKELLILESRYKSGTRKKVVGDKVITFEHQSLDKWFD